MKASGMKRRIAAWSLLVGVTLLATACQRGRDDPNPMGPLSLPAGDPTLHFRVRPPVVYPYRPAPRATASLPTAVYGTLPTRWDR
jgi:hypothetical protein